MTMLITKVVSRGIILYEPREMNEEMKKKSSSTSSEKHCLCVAMSIKLREAWRLTDNGYAENETEGDQNGVRWRIIKKDKQKINQSKTC